MLKIYVTSILGLTDENIDSMCANEYPGKVQRTSDPKEADLFIGNNCLRVHASTLNFITPFIKTLLKEQAKKEKAGQKATEKSSKKSKTAKKTETAPEPELPQPSVVLEEISNEHFENLAKKVNELWAAPVLTAAKTGKSVVHVDPFLTLKPIQVETKGKD